MANYRYVNVFFFLTIISCTNKNNNMNSDIKIIPLPPAYNRYISEMHSSMRGEFFAIKNLKSLDSVTMNKIDSFVEEFYNPSFDTINVLTLDFYRYDKTVNENLKHDPDSDRSIALYDGNLLLSYEWHKGRYLGTTYYKDGQIIRSYEHRGIKTR